MRVRRSTCNYQVHGSFPACICFNVRRTDNHMRETYISVRRRLDRRWIIFSAVLKDTSVPGILET